MTQNEMKLAIKHVTETCLLQVPEIFKQIQIIKDDENLSEDSKTTFNNFANYHLMIMSILLNETMDYAKENYPDAKLLLEWIQKNYDHCLEKKFFTKCRCNFCIGESEKSVLDMSM